MAVSALLRALTELMSQLYIGHYRKCQEEDQRRCRLLCQQNRHQGRIDLQAARQEAFVQPCDVRLSTSDLCSQLPDT